MAPDRKKSSAPKKVQPKGRSRRFRSQPLSTIPGGIRLPARHVVGPSQTHLATWSTLNANLRERLCLVCGHTSSSSRTRQQHVSEGHTGKRCHFPTSGTTICGQVFATEAELVNHLNSHLVPFEREESRKIRCGWQCDQDCANRRNQTGFTLQMSMFRHVRTHQAGKAKAAGDLVITHPNTNTQNGGEDDEDEEDDEDDDEDDDDDDMDFDPPERPHRGGNGGPPGSGGAPGSQAVAAH